MTASSLLYVSYFFWLLQFPHISNALQIDPKIIYSDNVLKKKMKMV